MSMQRDLVCFSHLRWGFVFQRPNHLMCRFAKQRRTFFIEEPIFDSAGESTFEVRRGEDDLRICIPHLPAGMSGERNDELLREALTKLFDEQDIDAEIAWFYTPMALTFADFVDADLTIYDCMDELSAFRGAPPQLVTLERCLFDRADLVFTGGQSLYESKRRQHPRVHCFPSSVDFDHFARARQHLPEPADQRGIGHPRIGFYGVIDERMDLELVLRLAEDRPDYQIVMIGPVVKIDEASLPQLPNVHWLGMKSYGELPAYLAGWDVAWMPFALNESTRFISPTKTLEYMAANCPVVSTAVADVVRPYGERGLARIVEAASCAAAIDDALAEDPAVRAAAGDRYLATTSWDATFSRMNALIDEALERPRKPLASKGEIACSTT